ncbi:MAG: HlyC/CorC family transporter, partial [Lachnospiraceae bacterium]
DHQKKMLSTILIGNNVVNIAASSLTTTFAATVFDSFAIGIAAGILTILVIIFGEITPKTVATLKADSMALGYARIIYCLMFAFTPLVVIVETLANIFMKLMGIDPDKKAPAITENELRTIVDVSHEEGVIESEERRMVNNVFDFGDSQAKDVMIPRIDMTVADIESSYEDLVTLFRQEKYTRIPIFEGETDNVVGIINIKDLFLFDSDKDFHVRDIIRQPYYTYEFKKTSDLLAELRKTSNNVTIVIDEYGSTVGMITLEDLLEEIVGEIRDEYDYDETDPIVRINDSEYLLEGTAKLDDINELFDIELESEDYDSIAGLLIERFDRLPNVGDELQIDNMRFIIEKVSKNRIDSIRVYITVPKTTLEPETI